jgi:hypothetical protein
MWMSAADSWVRSRRRRRGVSFSTSPPAERPRSGLVTQGARSGGVPRIRPSFDDMLRANRGAPVWNSIF